MPIYKYDVPVSALKLDKIKLQDDRLQIYGPIIMGLDKMNALMHVPYSSYHSNLVRSFSKNNKLIIIGYGFGDFYINVQIQLFIEYDNKHVLIISPSMPKYGDFVDPVNENVNKSTKYNIYWYKGTFKQASESETLMKFLNRFIEQ